MSYGSSTPGGNADFGGPGDMGPGTPGNSDSHSTNQAKDYGTLDRMSDLIGGYASKFMMAVADLAIMGVPGGWAAQALSKTLTHKTVAQNVKSMIADNKKKGMSEAQATKEAVTKAIADADASAFEGGENAKKALLSALNSQELAEATGTTMTTASTSKDSSRQIWDQLTQRFFQGQDFNNRVGTDFIKSMETETGKSFDMSTKQGRENWKEFYKLVGDNPNNPELQALAKKAGLEPTVFLNSMKEAVSIPTADDLFQTSAAHAARAATDFATGTNAALDKKGSVLDNLSATLNGSRLEQDRLLKGMTGVLKTGKDEQNSLLSSLIDKIQGGEGMYAPTQYSINGQQNSFLNKGARNTANLIADLGQDRFTNTGAYTDKAVNYGQNAFNNAADYTTKAGGFAQNQYTDKAAALKAILANAQMTNPVAGDLASLDALKALVADEETRKQNDTQASLDKLRIQSGTDIANRTADQADPGWLDYIKGGTSLLTSLDKLWG